jgi:prepilin-type N-terminal cleavage/methylation domain-containing protein/prepilin-type processing-associated H-X9-DG protein
VGIQNGFTLVEMLVVLVLIVLLASILVSGVNTSIRKAHATKGRSHLKQLHAAFIMYAQENGGRLPYQQADSSVTWHVDISQYLSKFENADFFALAQAGKHPPGVFACPASDHVVRPGNYSDFGMNFLVNDHGGSQPFQRGLPHIPQPDQIILLADSKDCQRRLSPFSEDGNLEARHPGDMVNVLFVGGSVRSASIEEVHGNISGDYRTTPPWGWETRDN